MQSIWEYGTIKLLKDNGVENLSEILGSFIYKNGALVGKPDQMEAFPGDSIYEVIRMVDSRLVFLEDHLDRFYGSLELAGKKAKPERLVLKESMERLIHANGGGSRNLRLVYVPLEIGFHLYMYLIPTAVPDEKTRKEGASVVTHRVDRENPNIKTVSQSYKDLLQQEGFQGKFELLLVDSQGWIREGSKTNIFFILNDSLVTPPAKEVLPGITRKKVLEICREEGIKVEEGFLSIQDLDQVSGIFLTGTSIGVLPVKDVDGRAFPLDHPVLKRLKDGYEKKAAQKEQESPEEGWTH
ncbi:aminotransferase class IV family protein [Alkalibacter rhizosphaerae]|uniref:Aminotransferase class IV family protein n=1 Tax=Alkalibacter rhizosphaerae TaxID=2815577 RepID=A0A974XGN9_9FIRM|nr:aminotransferase class IV [Alkalibacter rhizosphaerae]QSX08300.1 aminotransferase class IV family protein [Alkalibacter rhizosphaerae]